MTATRELLADLWYTLRDFFWPLVGVLILAGIVVGIVLLVRHESAGDRRTCEQLARETNKGVPVYVGDWVCIGERVDG